MKNINLGLYNIVILLVLIFSLGGCKFKNNMLIHDNDSIFYDDRVVGAWSIDRYRTLPYKTFVVTKEDGQYYLVESRDLQLHGSNNSVGRCYYTNFKKMKLRFWLFKIGNSTFAEIEDKTCEQSDKHSYVLYKIEIKNNELSITSTNSAWINDSVKRDSEFKKYLKGKDFKDTFAFPSSTARNLIQKYENDIFDVGEETKTAIRLPDDLVTVREAADQFRKMAPKLGNHIDQYRVRYEKANDGNTVNEYFCYGEAALLYKLAYLLGDDDSWGKHVEALQTYTEKIDPLLTKDKELNLYRCDSIISAYESYQEDTNKINTAIGVGIALGAIKKFYDWVSTPTSGSSYSSSTSSDSNDNKRWVCKIKCTGSGWATGPKGTLETYAPDSYTAQEQAASRGANELCSGSTGDGIYGKISTSGRPDVSCQQQY